MSQLPITTIYQGDTARLDFEAQEPDGSVRDLTDCEIRWAYSDPADLGTPLLEKTQEDGITILEAAAGRCAVTIDAGELDTPGTYVHELELTLPSGLTYTYAQGPLIIKPTVYPTA
jgi:hypothetical protein